VGISEHDPPQVIHRIGIVCPYSWDVPGGVRSHVADLANTLRERGYFVSVLAPVDNPEFLPEFVADGGAPTAVPYNGSVARLSFGIKATRRVRNWIRQGNFDVVHIHEPLAPSLSLLACWAAQGPLVATWHSSQDRSRILNAGYYIAQTAMEKIRGSIAVSEAARTTLVEHVGGDAVLIPNGVRVSDFRDQEGVSVAGAPLILFLGRIDEPRKGLSVLIEASEEIIARIPSVEFAIAGPGDPNPFIESMSPDVRAHFTFHGAVSDEEKRRLLHQADLYVAPHTGGESFGIVLVEAMASGTPVVASNIPAFSRVLQGGECGELFANGDAQDLAKKVCDLMEYPDTRREFVRRSNIRVMDFDWNSVVNDVIAVYESVHTRGEKVTEDLRGQIVGRFAKRGARE
jgi:phosphatidyl-myo-inositol alpha-mannosyltransferase